MSGTSVRDLAELRQLAGLTQGEVARALGRSQPAVSRLERQGDMLLSTLREYVHAVGGELRLIVEHSGEAHLVQLPAPSVEVPAARERSGGGGNVPGEGFDPPTSPV